MSRTTFVNLPVLDLDRAAEFFTDLQTMLAELRATPPMPGPADTGVLIPGDPETETEAINHRLGIPIKTPVLAELRALREELGLAWDLDEEER
jgi:LDH2 family malate/lactate/ureidoglycolate dehydrogenase